MALRREVKTVNDFSIESIGDIAYTMRNKKALRRIHRTLLLTGIPISVLQWTGILLWVMKGIRWPFFVWLAIAIPYAIWVSLWYFKRVAYLCPKCHQVFQPRLKEAFWARHTPSTRKLTCTCCGRHGFCVEVAREE